MSTAATRKKAKYLLLSVQIFHNINVAIIVFLRYICYCFRVLSDWKPWRYFAKEKKSLRKEYDYYHHKSNSRTLAAFTHELASQTTILKAFLLVSLQQFKFHSKDTYVVRTLHNAQNGIFWPLVLNCCNFENKNKDRQPIYLPLINLTGERKRGFNRYVATTQWYSF